MSKFVEFLGSSTSMVLLSFTQLDILTDEIKQLCNRTSFKCILLVLCLFGLLNTETYTGGLISSFINTKEESRIKNMEDLVTKDGHQLLLLNGTASVQYFSQSTEWPHKEIWETHLKNNSMAYFSKLKPIEALLLRDRKYIYFERTHIPEIFFKNYPCKIIRSEKTYFHRSVALGMKKDSPYLQLFNLMLLRYIETGITANIDTLKRNKKSEKTCTDDNHPSVGYEALTSAFAMLAGGNLLAMTCCFIEILIKHFRRFTRTACRELKYVVGDNNNEI